MYRVGRPVNSCFTVPGVAGDCWGLLGVTVTVAITVTVTVTSVAYFEFFFFDFSPAVLVCCYGCRYDVDLSPRKPSLSLSQLVCVLLNWTVFTA